MSEPSETPNPKPRRGRKAKATRKGKGRKRQNEQPAPAPAEPAPDSIELKGQKLVKVDRNEAAPEPAAPKSLDDVARKHGGAPLPEPEDAEPPEPEPPPIEEVARAAEVHGHGPVPPAESDPRKRDGSSMGQIDFTLDAPDLRDPNAKPHSLEDVMAIFPVGIDPQYYIHVVRKGPRNWGGLNPVGIMRPIRDSMTTAEFEETYGGGDYVLTVYGPPKRGGQTDPRTQLLRPKALTGNVVFTVPYGGAFGIPPNPDAAFEEGDEDEDMWMEDDMQRHRGGFPRPDTPAGASIHKANLEHDRDQRREHSEERREAEQRARAAEEDRVKEQQRSAHMVSEYSMEMMRMMSDSNRDEKAAERREKGEEIERRREAERRLEGHHQAEAERVRGEYERMTNKPTEVSEFATAMGPLLQAVSAKKDDGETRTLQSELKLVRDAHQSEMTRIHEQHAGELRREREAKDEVRKLADERVKDMRDTMDRRVTELTAQSTQRIKDIEDRAERDVKRAAEDGDRRANDIKQSWEGRIKDEEKGHRRELDSVKTSLDTRVSTEKTMADGQMTMLRGEVERERANAVRFEKEAREKGDLPKQIGKFYEAAEQLGMQRPGEGEQPANWQQTLSQVALQVATNLPESIKNAGEAVAGAKAPHVQVVQQPGMLPPGQAPPQQLGAPMGFGTSDGPEYEGEDWAPAPEQPPPAPPLAQQMAPAAAAPSPAPTMPHSAPAAAPAAAPPPPTAAPLPAKRRALKPPAAPPAPPAAAALPQPIPITDEVILSFQPPFEEAFRNRMPPEEFVAQLMQEHGQTMVQTVAVSLTPQMVMKALMTTPEGSRSPLVRGAGQKYLQKLLQAIKQAGG